MADIFISYAKADRNLTQQLAAQLEAQGTTTWWDTTIDADEGPRSTIEHELNRATKVLVLWSTASIVSPFVMHEAVTARDLGKLVQAKTSNIQGTDIPRSLRELPLLDVNDLAGIARAASGRAEIAHQLPAALVLPTRRLLGRSDARPNHGPAISEAAAAPTDSANRQSMSTGNKIFALAALLIALVDAAILLQYGLPDGLSGLATKFMGLLK